MVCSVCFFYMTQDHLPRGSTVHSRLVPATSSINGEDVPPKLAMGLIRKPSKMPWICLWKDNNPGDLHADPQEESREEDIFSTEMIAPFLLFPWRPYSVTRYEFQLTLKQLCEFLFWKGSDYVTGLEVTWRHGVQVYSAEVASYTVQPRHIVGITIQLCVSTHCKEFCTMVGSPGISSLSTYPVSIYPSVYICLWCYCFPSSVRENVGVKNKTCLFTNKGKEKPIFKQKIISFAEETARIYSWKLG